MFLLGHCVGNEVVETLSVGAPFQVAVLIVVVVVGKLVVVLVVIRVGMVVMLVLEALGSRLIAGKGRRHRCGQQQAAAEHGQRWWRYR